MKTKFFLLSALMFPVLQAFGAVGIDEEAFGKSLGGWKKRGPAEYPLAGADYRTHKPDISPTPDGGIFISVRIDHVRGWLSSNDHAMLEITVSPKGVIASAQSTIAIQGQSIKSDVIVGTTAAGNEILSPERAVQIGTDLVANLTAKLLRENIVEAGRVSFPAVLRHNYNRLFQSIRVDGVQVLPPGAPEPAPPVAKPVAEPGAEKAAVPSSAPTAPTAPTAPAAPPAPTTAPAAAPTPPAQEKPKEEPGSVPLEIKPYI